jgi:ferredoxin
LAQARRFYGGVLGCRESGSSEAAVDYEFFGHEISLCLGSVGVGLPAKAAAHSLPVPRLSISMDLPRWRTLAQRLMAAGLQFQVPADSSILETMLQHGHTPKFYCGRGECGICPMTVVSADGPLEHRDQTLKPDEKASGKKICICVSRVKGTRLVLDA